MTTIEKLSPVMPKELSRYISPDQILENAANHHEMQRDYTPSQHVAITAIKDMLLDVPLTHGTRKPFESFVNDGILPEIEIDKTIHLTHTRDFDRAIGMNRYTFMSWGDFRNTQYGTSVISLDTRKILPSSHTIVTPYDINGPMFNYLDSHPNALDSEGTLKFDAYLSSIVSGDDWLEIVSRRYINRVLSGSTVVVQPLKNMGEIKHFGTVPSEYITGLASSRSDHQAKWKGLLEQGFMADPVESALFGSSSDYDRTPEQLGADMDKSKAAWAKVIDLANS